MSSPNTNKANSMKHIIIVLKDITESGGGERVCVNLANAFSECMKVSIISFYRSQEQSVFALDKRIHVRYLSAHGEKQSKIRKIFNKLLFRYYLSLKTCYILKQMRADIALANDGLFTPFIKVKHTKYVRLWHIKTPKKRKKVFARFDSLVILSARDLEAWRHYHPSLRVIPNFLPSLPNISTNYTQKVVISAGRMDRGDQKGFLRLIDIWDLVMQDSSLRGWRLHIVGDGSMKEEIQEKIKSKNLQNSIILKPFTKDIDHEYVQASIYAMASNWEGFGMVLIESNACGLPAIAFDIATGPSDIIVDSLTGYLVQDKDLHTYATRLQHLMNDSALRENLGKQAKQRVMQCFSKQAVMPLWQDIINDK